MNAQVDALRRRLQRVEATLAQLEQAAVELQRARSTLESLGEHDALVPIGGGYHVHARLVDGPIVAPIGAGYAADQTLDEAKASLDSRLADLQQAIQQHVQEADQLAMAAEQMDAQ